MDYAEDKTSIGPASGDVIFQAGDSPPGVFAKQAFPFASIYGLALLSSKIMVRAGSLVFFGANAAAATFQSAFYQMWKQGAYPTPFLSCVGCYKTSKDACKGADGLHTFGGYDQELGKDLIWHDVVGVPEVNVLDFPLDPPMFNYWAADVTGVWIGDDEQPLNTSAGNGTQGVFDHASRGRGAPLAPNSYQKLVQLTEGKVTPLNSTTGPNNAEKQKFYQVDCAKADGFLTFKYQLKGNDKVWEITPSTYVEEMQPGMCVLNIRAIGTAGWLIGNFGEQFLVGKYIVMDFENLCV